MRFKLFNKMLWLPPSSNSLSVTLTSQFKELMNYIKLLSTHIYELKVEYSCLQHELDVLEKKSYFLRSMLYNSCTTIKSCSSDAVGNH